MIGSEWSGLTIEKSPSDPLCWPNQLTVSPTTLAGAAITVDSTTNVVKFDATSVTVLDHET